IVFIQPCQPERDYIKRVIALGGQTVEVRCNVVYVDGEPVPSELIDGEGCRYDDREDPNPTWFERTCSRYRETAGDLAYDTYHDDERPARDAELRRTGAISRLDQMYADRILRDFPLRASPSNCSTASPMEGGPLDGGPPPENQH